MNGDLRLVRCRSIQECKPIIFSDIGVFLQSFAHLEVVLDDLFCLAGDVLGARNIRRCYPTNFVEKIDLLTRITELTNKHERCCRAVPSTLHIPALSSANRLRNILAHGIIRDVVRGSNGYCILVDKISRPQRVSATRQELIWRREEAWRHELVSELLIFKNFLEAMAIIRSAVFSCSKGWPNYVLVAPENLMVSYFSAEEIFRTNSMLLGLDADGC